MDNLSSLETKLEEILTKGAKTLKIEYFNFAIRLEEQAKNIGIDSVYFHKSLMKLNNRPIDENVKIRKQDLLNVYPEIKCEQGLKLFAEYNVIYHSSFFERMKTPYDGFVGIMYEYNKANFEHDDLSMEFKQYKASLKKAELECELDSINKEIKDKKLKI
jgi:hypothetical protein